MKIQLLPQFASALILGSLMFNAAHASTFTIDNFSMSQTVTDRGDTPGSTSNFLNPISGTDLVDASRTLIAESAFGTEANKTKIKITAGDLKISNNDDSAVLASVLWRFAATDFTVFGDALTLQVKDHDLKPTEHLGIELIANGTSSTGIKSFTGVGEFMVNFADFLQPITLASVNSLRINFTGPAAWDGKFGALSITHHMAPQISSIPLPPSLWLMATSLVGLLTFSRSKSQQGA